VTAAVVIGVVALILLVTNSVLALHVIRQTSSDAFRALDRIESRSEKSLQTVLDRLMTIKWEDFAAVKSLEEDTSGGFFAPVGGANTDEAGGQTITPAWASVRERLSLNDEERELLEEDFPAEMGVEK
jgi:hypothetical protein